MDKTVKDVIDAIVAGVPGAPFPETVDTLKTGDPHQKVTGIAVTFLATYDVIQQAIQKGINLILTHEPTFYNHLDETNWLDGDSVYQVKRKLIDENHIAIWRFHDYLHSLQPDPTLTGLIKALGWTTYRLPNQPFVCKLPSRTLNDVVLEVKSRLGLKSVRVVGDPQMTCQLVGLVVGATGGRMHIELASESSLDLLVCGEINEWETNIYVQDAAATGKPKALIVIGHSVSEEDGMREVVPWIQARIPEIPVTYIPTGHNIRSS